MIPAGFKDLLVPGSTVFLIAALLPGLALLLRSKDGGRLGRIWVAFLVLIYWVLSTPITALIFIDLCSPDVPAILSKADADGATAIVVLGAGMEVHRSRGSLSSVPTRAGSLRVLEAARLHALLGLPIVATGGLGSSQYSEAGLMARQLEELGVPADRITKEEKSTNTHDHVMLVPPLLKQQGITRFVLVTSRQHMARAVAAFRAVGADPVRAAPDVFAPRGDALEMFLPSRIALSESQAMVYDLLGWVYYKYKGWV